METLLWNGTAVILVLCARSAAKPANTFEVQHKQHTHPEEDDHTTTPPPRASPHRAPRQTRPRNPNEKQENNAPAAAAVGCARSPPAPAGAHYTATASRPAAPGWSRGECSRRRAALPPRAPAAPVAAGAPPGPPPTYKVNTPAEVGDGEQTAFPGETLTPKKRGGRMWERTHFDDWVGELREKKLRHHQVRFCRRRRCGKPANQRCATSRPRPRVPRPPFHASSTPALLLCSHGLRLNRKTSAVEHVCLMYGVYVNPTQTTRGKP